MSEPLRYYTPRNRPPRIQVSMKGEVSRTKKAMAEECDINNIMKKFKATGQLPDMIRKNGAYGDFADVRTYQESLELVRFAEEQFNGLSAAVRKEFRNDPGEFLAFAEDPANIDRMAELGLVSPEAVRRVHEAKEREKKASEAAAPRADKKKAPVAEGGGE